MLLAQKYAGCLSSSQRPCGCSLIDLAVFAVQAFTGRAVTRGASLRGAQVCDPDLQVVTSHGTAAQVKSVTIGGLSAVVLPPQAGLVFTQVATAPSRRDPSRDSIEPPPTSPDL